MKNTGEMLGDKIVKLRKSRDLSQEKFSELADVPRRTLQNIESGETASPGIDTVMQIALALEMPLGELVGEKQVIPKDLIGRVVESVESEDPLRVASLLLGRFAAAPPRLRAVVLAYLFQDFEIMRKYQKEIAALMPKPK